MCGDCHLEALLINELSCTKEVQKFWFTAATLAPQEVPHVDTGSNWITVRPSASCIGLTVNMQKKVTITLKVQLDRGQFGYQTGY